jgi:hypothetical protein
VLESRAPSGSIGCAATCLPRAHTRAQSNDPRRRTRSRISQQRRSMTLLTAATHSGCQPPLLSSTPPWKSSKSNNDQCDQTPKMKNNTACFTLHPRWSKPTPMNKRKSIASRINALPKPNKTLQVSKRPKPRRHSNSRRFKFSNVCSPAHHKR